jgi:multiple sugar transport system substrate-binding protein
MNTPEAKAGIEFMQKIYSETNWAVPYGNDAEAAFRAGQVAMFQNGRWATPGVRTVTFKYDAVQLPNGPAGTPGNWLFWGSYVVNANTKHPAEAWKLVQELTQADIQGKIASRGTNIPSRVSDEAFKAFLTFTPPDNAQAFLDGIADAAKPSAEGPLWAGDWPKVNTAYDNWPARPEEAVWGYATKPWPIPAVVHCLEKDCPFAGPHKRLTPGVR